MGSLGGWRGAYLGTVAEQKSAGGALRSVLWSPNDLERRESQGAFPRQARSLNQCGAPCTTGPPWSMDPTELLR